MSLIKKAYSDVHELIIKGWGSSTMLVTPDELNALRRLLLRACQEEDERNLAEVRRLGT